MPTPPSLRSQNIADIRHLPPPSPLAKPVMSASADIPTPQSATLDHTAAASTTASPAATTEAGAVSPKPAAEAEDPFEGVPALTTAPATTTGARVDALKLVTDSVAQQRAIASRALIYNPALAGAVIAFAAVVSRYLYSERNELALVATTSAGIVMAALLAVRWAVSGYVPLAEGIGWKWLDDNDDVLVTWFGEEAIGTVVIRWAASGEGKRGKKKGKRALIRAWTVSGPHLA
jgi:hypothetical protein